MTMIPPINKAFLNKVYLITGHLTLICIIYIHSNYIYENCPHVTMHIGYRLEELSLYAKINLCAAKLWEDTIFL